MAEYPQVTFVATDVRQSGPTSLELTGDLTIRGVTNSVTIPFEFEGAATDPYGNLRVGFEGSAVINRKDYGITWTPRSRPAASWSAKRSPSNSRCPRSRPPDLHEPNPGVGADQLPCGRPPPPLDPSKAPLHDHRYLDRRRTPRSSKQDRSSTKARLVEETP